MNSLRLLRSALCVVLTCALSLFAVPAAAFADNGSGSESNSDSSIALQVAVTLQSGQSYSSLSKGEFSFAAQLVETPEVYCVAADQMTEGQTYRISGEGGSMVEGSPLYSLDAKGNIASTKANDSNLCQDKVLLQPGQCLMRVEQAQVTKMVSVDHSMPLYETPGNTSSFFIVEDGSVLWPDGSDKWDSYLWDDTGYTGIDDDVTCAAYGFWEELKNTGCFTPYDGSLVVSYHWSDRTEKMNGWLACPGKAFYRNTGETLAAKEFTDFFAETTHDVAMQAGNAAVKVAPGATADQAQARVSFPVLHPVKTQAGTCVAGTYKFDIAQTGEDAEGVQIDRHSLTATVEVGADGQVGPVRYASAEAADHPALFVNTRADASFSLNSTGTLDGEAADVPAFAYTATLAQVDDAACTGSLSDYFGTGAPKALKAEGSADGEILFPSLSPKVAGTYRFEITQDADQPLHDRYLPDTGKVTVAVTVEEVDGVLETTSCQIEGEKKGFENYTYAAFAPSTEVYLNGKAASETFSFENTLKSVLGEEADLSKDYAGQLGMDDSDAYCQTAASDSKGAVDFPQVVLRQEGTYEFQITQRNTDGYLCDDAAIPVTAKVTRNAKGAFVADVAYGAPEGRTQAEFYNASPATVQIEASVCLDYGYLKDGMFAVSAVQTSGPNLGEGGAAPLQLEQENAADKVSFKEQKADKAGTYVFEVSEKAGTDEDILYSKAVYTVEAQVAWKPTSKDSEPQVAYTYSVKDAGDREAAPGGSKVATVPFVNACDLAKDKFPGIDLSIDLEIIGNSVLADYDEATCQFQAECVSAPSFLSVSPQQLGDVSASGTYCVMGADGVLVPGEGLYTLSASGDIVSTKTKDERLVNGMVQLKDGEKLVRINRFEGKQLANTGYREYENKSFDTRWCIVKAGTVFEPTAEDSVTEVFPDARIHFNDNWTDPSYKYYKEWTYSNVSECLPQYWNSLKQNGYFNTLRTPGYNVYGIDMNGKIDSEEEYEPYGWIASDSVDFYSITSDVIAPASYKSDTFFISEYQTNAKFAATVSRDAVPTTSAQTVAFPRIHLQKTKEGSYVPGEYVFDINQITKDNPEMTIDTHTVTVRVQVKSDGTVESVKYSAEGTDDPQLFTNKFDGRIVSLKVDVSAADLPADDALSVVYKVVRYVGPNMDEDPNSALSDYIEGLDESGAVSVKESGAFSHKVCIKKPGVYYLSQTLVCASPYSDYYQVDDNTALLAVAAAGQGDALAVYAVDYNAGNTPLTAHLKEFDLEFDMGGGAPAVQGQKVKYGAMGTAPNQPVRAGYAFGGWYSDTQLTNEWDFATAAMPAKNVTLHAKWTELPDVAIGYKAGEHGSVSIASEQVAPATGEPQGCTAVPDAGYHFAGWTKASDEEWSSGDEVLAPERVDGLNVAETYTAQFAPNQDTAYRVEHFLQKADGSWPDRPTWTDELTGTTGEKTSAQARTQDGFSPQTFSQKAIAGDGGTVVVIRYARNASDAALDANNNGAASDGSSSSADGGKAEEGAKEEPAAKGKAELSANANSDANADGSLPAALRLAETGDSLAMVVSGLAFAGVVGLAVLLVAVRRRRRS